MLRSISIVAAVAALLAGGALSAAAGNSHGKAVSHLATSTTLRAEAKGDAISTLARALSEVASSGAAAKTTRTKANVTPVTAPAEADTDTDATDAADTNDAADSNEVADTNEAADTKDANDRNDGGTVSAIAHKDKGEADQGD
jgi:hypothetical protein